MIEIAPRIKHANSLTRKCLDYVHEAPGSSTKQIAYAINPDQPRRFTQRALEYLKDKKVIENRGGGTGHPTAWYPVPLPKVKAKYIRMAADIYGEMLELHHTKREEFLAQKLQELCS